MNTMRLMAGSAALAALALAACGRTEPSVDPGADTSLSETPPLPMVVDSSIPPAVAGADGWNYQLRADADFTGDGQTEKVILTARVEMYRGRPAWDDGQPWQVYVEAADGTRTYLYAQRLQLGTLTMRVAHGENGRPATIVLLEHLPDRLSVYEASYVATDKYTVALRFQRNLDPVGETASPSLP